MASVLHGNSRTTPRIRAELGAQVSMQLTAYANPRLHHLDQTISREAMSLCCC
jgi:hypothetical protein